MIKTVEHYPTGIQKLDQMLGGGLYAGLIFLGARPGMGKSTLALQIASEEMCIRDSSCGARYLNWDANIRIPVDTDILINGTSIGFSRNVNDRPDVDYTTVTDKMCACDVVFYPEHTQFLQATAANLSLIHN